MKIDWFTSDEHYGHANIIKYCNRPYDSVEGMNRDLIARHNSVVKPGDVVCHVGDFVTRTTVVPGIVPQLNGTHILIRGNHDKIKHMNRYLAAGFSSIHEKLWIECGHKMLTIQHIPENENRVYDNLERIERETIIHGHTHSKEKASRGHVHVGVDAWNYFPVSFDTVLELCNIKEKEIKNG